MAGSVRWKLTTYPKNDDHPSRPDLGPPATELRWFRDRSPNKQKAIHARRTWYAGSAEMPHPQSSRPPRHQCRGTGSRRTLTVCQLVQRHPGPSVARPHDQPWLPRSAPQHLFCLGHTTRASLHAASVLDTGPPRHTSTAWRLRPRTTAYRRAIWRAHARDRNPWDDHAGQPSPSDSRWENFVSPRSSHVSHISYVR